MVLHERRLRLTWINRARSWPCGPGLSALNRGHAAWDNWTGVACCTGQPGSGIEAKSRDQCGRHGRGCPECDRVGRAHQPGCGRAGCRTQEQRNEHARPAALAGASTCDANRHAVELDLGLDARRFLGRRSRGPATPGHVSTCANPLPARAAASPATPPVAAH